MTSLSVDLIPLRWSNAGAASAGTVYQASRVTRDHRLTLVEDCGLCGRGKRGLGPAISGRGWVSR